MHFDLTRSAIITVIQFVLAIIPATIAGKKSYNRILFYVYGIVMFPLALIHSLILPDRQDESRKQYKGKAVFWAVAAVFTLTYATFVGALYDFSWMWRNLFNYGNKFILYLLPFLILAALLGRQYRYSLVVYCAFILIRIYDIGALCLRLSGERVVMLVRILPYSLIVSAFSVAGIVTGMVLTLRYGVKKQSLKQGKGGFLFALPALLQLVSFVLDNIFSLRYMEFVDFMVTDIVEILMVLGIFALGRFLYNEAEREKAE